MPMRVAWRSLARRRCHVSRTPFSRPVSPVVGSGGPVNCIDVEESTTKRTRKGNTRSSGLVVQKLPETASLSSRETRGFGIGSSFASVQLVQRMATTHIDEPLRGGAKTPFLLLPFFNCPAFSFGKRFRAE